MCDRKGIHLVYLPPYSPNLNPIEQSFAQLKAWMRKHYKTAALYAHAQKRFGRRRRIVQGDGSVTGRSLGAELQVKGESRHGEAGQDATRWWSVQPDPATMALRIDGVCGEDSDTDAELLSLRPLLKPQKSMVMYLINSGGKVSAPTSLKAMAVGN
jgi:hypothetical protein